MLKYLTFCRSEVVYKAKKTNSVTFQQFHCLTLDVANARGGVGSTSIDSCLSSYFAEEVRNGVMDLLVHTLP